MPLYDLTRRLLDRYRFLRYASVSAVVVPFGQVLLFLFHGVFGWDAVLSNALGVAISAIPAFILNKRWVWGAAGKAHVTREIVPFWAMAFAGLALSTWFVEIVTDRTDIALAVNGASIAAFGVLWVVKFFVCDQWLFGPATEERPKVAAEVTTAP